MMFFPAGTQKPRLVPPIRPLAGFADAKAIPAPPGQPAEKIRPYPFPPGTAFSSFFLLTFRLRTVSETKGVNPGMSIQKFGGAGGIRTHVPQDG